MGFAMASYGSIAIPWRILCILQKGGMLEKSFLVDFFYKVVYYLFKIVYEALN